MLEEVTPVSFSIFLSKLICGVVPMPDLISKAAAYASASNSSFLDSPEMTTCDKYLPIIGPRYGINLLSTADITNEIALTAEKVIRDFFVCPNAKCPNSCAITEVSSTPETWPNLYCFKKPSVI
jgi:hypothetical protein